MIWIVWNNKVVGNLLCISSTELFANVFEDVQLISVPNYLTALDDVRNLEQLVPSR